MEWSASRVVVFGVGCRRETTGESDEPPAFATTGPATRGRVPRSRDRGALAHPRHGIDAAKRRPLGRFAAASAGVKRKKTKSTSGQKQQRSERELNDGFWVAYNLIYKDHDYAAGIAKLHSLGHDDLAEIANLIGYSSRKLGRYDDAKYWYEKALAANPKYARTWSYYGMWHAEQGNLLKAQDILEKVRSICGTECKEYTELKGVIEGTVVY
jgi:tetratricopeptide (TPR) repeat protein